MAKLSVQRTNEEWSQEMEAKVSSHDTQIERLNQLAHLVVLVLLIMTATLVATVAGIVINAWQNQSSSYDQLSKEVNQLYETQVLNTTNPPEIRALK